MLGLKGMREKSGAAGFSEKMARVFAALARTRIFRLQSHARDCDRSCRKCQLKKRKEHLGAAGLAAQPFQGKAKTGKSSESGLNFGC